MKKSFNSRNKFILTVFILFQLLVAFNFFLASQYIEPKGNFSYIDQTQYPRWLWRRANFDGIHYIEIAKGGYGLYQQAFFPFYPVMINYLSHFLRGQYLLAGFLISFGSFLAALFVLYELVKLDWQDNIAKRTILNLIIFPTSFFFAGVYTESLFLLLVLLAFYWARKKKWLFSSLAAGLASATRLVGIFLVPALLWQAWHERPKGKRLKASFLFLVLWIVLISSSGLLLYMNFLDRQNADPLMFIHLQPRFGAQRSAGRIILLYQVFWRYLKMIITCQKNTVLYFTVWLEVLSAVLFLAVLIWAWFKKLNRGYLIFATAAFLVPTLSGSFSSLPRYVLTLFPAFLAFSLLQEKYRILSWFYLILSGSLFFICQFLFSQGYWIS